MGCGCGKRSESAQTSAQLPPAESTTQVDSAQRVDSGAVTTASAPKR